MDVRLLMTLALLAFICTACVQRDDIVNGTNQEQATQAKDNALANDSSSHGQQTAASVSTGWNASSFVKPSDAQLRSTLTPEQYDVTQHDGTETPFENAYWDNHAAGIYVDIVSGEPLFSSLDKFDSGTGWPSFSKPLAPENIAEKSDYGIGYPRTEVRSKHADSHLGHVFDDGPQPTGLRFCMDSASLRFIPTADLEKEGYGQYSSLFVNVTE